MFRRKKKEEKSYDKVEARFQQVVDLVSDLDKKEFKRLMEGIELTWQGYAKMRDVKTMDEKADADIADSLSKVDEYIELKEE